MNSEYKNYTKDDIVDELFMFLDELIDADAISDSEIKWLGKLRERFYELCQKGE